MESLQILVSINSFKASISYFNKRAGTAFKPASAILYEMRWGPTTPCSFDQAKLVAYVQINVSSSPHPYHPWH